jgi:hypothetical protein
MVSDRNNRKDSIEDVAAIGYHMDYINFVPSLDASCTRVMVEKRYFVIFLQRVTSSYHVLV